MHHWSHHKQHETATMRLLVLRSNSTLSNVHIRRSGTKNGRIRVRQTSTKTNVKRTPDNPDPNSFIPLQSFSIGTIAGFAGSLAGMGGGFIMIPMMTSASMLSLTQHVAHGTSLFAVTTTGLAGGASYFSSGNVDLLSAASIAISGMVTARLGAKFASKLSQKELKKVLGIFMIGVSPVVPLKPYLVSIKGQEDEEVMVEDNMVGKLKTVGISSCIGLFSGFMAGLLGVGGGAVVVPALTLFTPMDHYSALGTSLTAMSLPAIVGTVTHYQAGNLNLRVAPFLALGSIVGAYGGGKIGVQVDEDYLRFGFSGLMATLGVRTLLKA